jgi:hypothetical protein
MCPETMKELGVVKLAAPCPAKWSRMKGDDRVRFCAKCGLNVFNISKLTSEEARSLFRKHEGDRLCVRFWKREDGTVMTEDCPRGLQRLRNLSGAMKGLGALAALFVVFVTVVTLFGDNIRRLFGMSAGDMVAWEPPTQKFDVDNPPPQDAPDWLKRRAQSVRR